MIRKMLLFATLALVANSVAASPAYAGCNPGDPQSFINVVQVLSPGYMPKPGNNGYQPPSGTPLTQLNLPSNSPILTDLANAFGNAPPTFQARLCGTAGTPGLTGIFINANGCAQNDPTKCNLNSGGANFNRAWGFRSYDPNASDYRATYIAIAAADLWANGNPARLLSDYETQLLASFPGYNGATVAPAAPNDPWMSVLAAMAHEVGHVRWAQTLISIPGGNYDTFNLLIDCPAGDFFRAGITTIPTRITRTCSRRTRRAGGDFFGVARARPVTLLTTVPRHSSIFFRNGLDNPQTANSDLWTLYQSTQPWASLFAAQAPDEDFVESYVMAVLTGYDPIKKQFPDPATSKWLTSMPLNAGYSPFPDVPNDLVTGQKLTLPPVAPGLQNKISCIPL